MKNRCFAFWTIIIPFLILALCTELGHLQDYENQIWSKQSSRGTQRHIEGQHQRKKYGPMESLTSSVQSGTESPHTQTLSVLVTSSLQELWVACDWQCVTVFVCVYMSTILLTFIHPVVGWQSTMNVCRKPSCIQWGTCSPPQHWAAVDHWTALGQSEVEKNKVVKNIISKMFQVFQEFSHTETTLNILFNVRELLKNFSCIGNIFKRVSL